MKSSTRPAGAWQCCSLNGANALIEYVVLPLNRSKHCLECTLKGIHVLAILDPGATLMRGLACQTYSGPMQNAPCGQTRRKNRAIGKQSAEFKGTRGAASLRCMLRSACAVKELGANVRLSIGMMARIGLGRWQMRVSIDQQRAATNQAGKHPRCRAQPPSAMGARPTNQCASSSRGSLVEGFRKAN